MNVIPDFQTHQTEPFVYLHIVLRSPLLATNRLGPSNPVRQGQGAGTDAFRSPTAIPAVAPPLSFPQVLAGIQGKGSRVHGGFVQCGLVLFRRRVTPTTGLFPLFSLTTYPCYPNEDFVSIDGRLQLYIS